MRKTINKFLKLLTEKKVYFMDSDNEFNKISIEWRDLDGKHEEIELMWCNYEKKYLL